MKPVLHAVLILIRHELKLEVKNKNNLWSLIIYSIASVYCIYLGYRLKLDTASFVTLYWIVMLFASTNAVVKSFLASSKGLQLFYLTILSPRAVILAKTIYNSSLLFLIGLINLFCFALFFENQINDMLQYVLIIFLGCIGFASVFTLMAGLVSRVNNNAALIAILGFPIILPLLIIVIQASLRTLEGYAWNENLAQILQLSSLDIVTIALAYLLFPYLWQE